MNTMIESAAEAQHGATELFGASPEVKLVLRCARQPMDAESAREIRELAGQELRWEAVLDFARWHCLGELLQARLTEAGVESIPDAVWHELMTMSQENAERNQTLTSELVHLSQQFQATDLPALPFKGPALAEMAWELPETRRAFNLDFLIRPGDLRAAKAILARCGYECLPMGGGFTGHSQWHLESQIACRHAETGVLVALHQQIVPRRYGYGIRFADLWKRREITRLSGESIPVLSVEDCLIVLCLHAIKNGFWPRLRLISDVAGLTAKRKIDWGRLMGLAAALDAERAVLVGLSLARTLLSAHMPRHIVERIESDPVIQSVGALVCRRIMACQLGFPNLVEATRVHASLRATPLGRFCYLFGVFTTPSERDQNFLGRPVPLAMSYIVRQLKLAGKCLHQLPHAILRR